MSAACGGYGNIACTKHGFCAVVVVGCGTLYNIKQLAVGFMDVVTDAAAGLEYELAKKPALVVKFFGGNKACYGNGTIAAAHVLTQLGVKVIGLFDHGFISFLLNTGICGIVFSLKIVYNRVRNFSSVLLLFLKFTENKIIMDMNFYAPVRIITGKGCVAKNSALFADFGKKAIIVTGKSSAKKCGALDDVVCALKNAGVEYTVFDGIEQNPSYASCLKAAEQAKDYGARFVIGIGGGSPLDAAKAVAVLAACGDTSVKALYSMEWDALPLPVVAVGTTAGTGSEVTSVAVITSPDGLKKSFRAPSLYPAVAFGDASYTLSLPTDFTRSTALDALCHCVESYFNRTTNDICRTFGLRGIAILLEMLKKTASCDATELSFEDREKLYCASVYGGLAISVAGTAFPHAMGYFLSEQYGVAHGNACAVYLEEFINYNEKTEPECTAEFFKALGTDKQSFVSLIKSNLPKIDVKLDKNSINALLPRFENNKSLNKCYGNADAAFAKALLEKLFG